MKLKYYILFSLTILFNRVSGQSSYPTLESDSAIESLAIYKGNLVVVVPIQEYKFTNVVLESLLSEIGKLEEIDSVKDLRLANLENQIQAKDKRIEDLVKDFAVCSQESNQEKEKLKRQRNRLAVVAGVYVLNTIRKIYLLFDPL